MSERIECDIAVVGAGPAGLATAIGLARRGARTLLITGPERGVDHRTTALMEGSVRVLDDIGVWERLRAHTTPLRDLRIVDATRRLLRAPEVLFRASEIGLEAFGHNIENDILRGELRAVSEATENLEIVPASATGHAADADTIRLALDDGRSVSARLAVAADGRKSRMREAAGIRMRTRAYPQVALTFTVRHTRPHEEISTEFHTESGPFTLVPLHGNRSSIVCVVSERDAVRLLGLDAPALARELERRAFSLLGAFEAEDGRGAFPLAAESAAQLTAPRLALMAEAAHVMPPIGAQGLNLGLRDAAAVLEIAGSTAARGSDPGDPAVLERYTASRRRDIDSRMAAVDVLNRSLLSDFVPMQGLRGLGLYMMQKVGPLRRGLMRLGAGLNAA